VPYFSNKIAGPNRCVQQRRPYLRNSDGGDVVHQRRMCLSFDAALFLRGLALFSACSVALFATLIWLDWQPVGICRRNGVSLLQSSKSHPGTLSLPYRTFIYIFKHHACRGDWRYQDIRISIHTAL